MDIIRVRGLFPHEPTTGLDPRGRIAMWDIISGLVNEGTTVLLTTQYLDEADQLANQIVVVDDGQVIARGTSDQLKTQIGGERMDMTLARGSELGPALLVLARYSDGEPRVEPERRFISLAITHGAHQLPSIVRDLDAAGVRLDDLSLRKPTLDDVFLSLTGHVAQSPSDEPTDKKVDHQDDDAGGGDTGSTPNSGAHNQRSSDTTNQKVSV